MSRMSKNRSVFEALESRGDAKSGGPAADAAPRRPASRPCETCVEFEVPFHDVDALNIVWHGNHYRYLELARTALLRRFRLDLGDLRELRHGFLVIETSCRYVSPLRYGDQVRVAAWLRDTTYRLHIAYEVSNLTRGRRAARAHTALVTTDPDGRMLLRTPPEILERLGVGGA